MGILKILTQHQEANDHRQTLKHVAHLQQSSVHLAQDEVAAFHMY